MVGTRTPYRAGVDGRVSPVVWVLLEEPVVVEPGDVVPEEPDPTPVPPVGATYAAEVESMVEALPEVADELAVVHGLLPGGVSVLRRGKKTLAGIFTSCNHGWPRFQPRCWR